MIGRILPILSQTLSGALLCGFIFLISILNLKPLRRDLYRLPLPLACEYGEGSVPAVSLPGGHTVHAQRRFAEWAGDVVG